jgi:hypothetical protein
MDANKHNIYLIGGCDGLFENYLIYSFYCEYLRAKIDNSTLHLV